MQVVESLAGVALCGALAVLAVLLLVRTACAFRRPALAAVPPYEIAPSPPCCKIYPESLVIPNPSVNAAPPQGAYPTPDARIYPAAAPWRTTTAASATRTSTTHTKFAATFRANAPHPHARARAHPIDALGGVGSNRGQPPEGQETRAQSTGFIPAGPNRQRLLPASTARHVEVPPTHHLATEYQGLDLQERTNLLLRLRTLGLVDAKEPLEEASYLSLLQRLCHAYSSTPLSSAKQASFVDIGDVGMAAAAVATERKLNNERERVETIKRLEDLIQGHAPFGNSNTAFLPAVREWVMKGPGHQRPPARHSGSHIAGTSLVASTKPPTRGGSEINDAERERIINRLERSFASGANVAARNNRPNEYYQEGLEATEHLNLIERLCSMGAKYTDIGHLPYTQLLETWQTIAGHPNDTVLLTREGIVGRLAEMGMELRPGQWHSMEYFALLKLWQEMSRGMKSERGTDKANTRKFAPVVARPRQRARAEELPTRRSQTHSVEKLRAVTLRPSSPTNTSSPSPTGTPIYEPDLYTVDEPVPRTPLLDGQRRMGVLLLNLGGPETLDDVEPFLRNLFSDGDIIRLPPYARVLQGTLGALIAKGRASKSKQGYAAIGGGSPQRRITEAQGTAVQAALASRGTDAKVYVGMRYWHPFATDTMDQIKRDGITDLVILPLYPQYSISTSGSSLKELDSLFRNDPSLNHLRHVIIPTLYKREGYITSMADMIQKELAKSPPGTKVFFSAHGVPKSYIEQGDPYQEQMEDCVSLIMDRLRRRGVDNTHILAYQSKVGPVEWLKPYTNDEIVRECNDGVAGLVVVPISFVGEHIETLEEIDQEYQDLAMRNGLPYWGRVPALGLNKKFISSVAEAVCDAAQVLSNQTADELEMGDVGRAWEFGTLKDVRSDGTYGGTP